MSFTNAKLWHFATVFLIFGVAANLVAAYIWEYHLAHRFGA